MLYIYLDNYILYTSSYSGVDNIYAYDISTKEFYQVSCRPYGAYDAEITEDKKSIYFSDFTATGSQIASMPYEPKNWKKISKVENRSVTFFEKLIISSSFTPSY